MAANILDCLDPNTYSSRPGSGIWEGKPQKSSFISGHMRGGEGKGLPLRKKHFIGARKKGTKNVATELEVVQSHQYLHF